MVAKFFMCERKGRNFKYFLLGCFIFICFIVVFILTVKINNARCQKGDPLQPDRCKLFVLISFLCVLESELFYFFYFFIFFNNKGKQRKMQKSRIFTAVPNR